MLGQRASSVLEGDRVVSKVPEGATSIDAAGQTRLAVRLHAPTAAKAQRTKKCWPQTGRIALHPAKDVNRQFGVDANHR
jgi:hypothetical protein